MFLSPDELKQLTRRSRSDAQARELKHMGIEHRIRRDGTIAVSQAHAEQVLAGAGHTRKTKEVEPNWEAAK